MLEPSGFSGARQGSSMTEQWKFVTGNCAFGRKVKGTAYPAMAMLKLPRYEITGRIEREHDAASRGVMGRLRKSNRFESYHGGMTEPEGLTASPVFQWRHVRKIIQVNSGEHTVSPVHPIMSSTVNGRTEVAHPITQRGNGGNALCVVGVAGSTGDSEDSITSREGSGYTRNTAVHNSGETLLNHQEEIQRRSCICDHGQEGACQGHVQVPLL